MFNYNIAIGPWREKAWYCERAHARRPSLVKKSSGRVSLRKNQLSCHHTDDRKWRDRSRQVLERTRGGIGSLRIWRKHGWNPQRMRRQEPGGPGPARPWKENIWGNKAVESHWRIFSLGVTWAYLFYKTLASMWRVDWNEARDGVGSQVIYVAFFWCLIFLYSFPPLYARLLGSNEKAIIFSSRHGDIICITKVQ